MNSSKISRRRAAAIVAAAPATLFASSPDETEDYYIEIRGHSQNLRRLKGKPISPGLGRRILIASGDGGLHPFGETIAHKLANWGFDAYRFNSQHYLHGFTGATPLTPEQAQADLGSVVATLRADSEHRVVLMGWSAGADLAVLAGAAPELKPHLEGVVAVALPAEGVLGWRWTDNFQFFPGVEAGGPFFEAGPYLAALPPLPVLILQSDNDRWVSEADYQQLAERAQEPKRTVFMEAGGHSFPDDRRGFFRALEDGLSWMFAARAAQTEG